MKAREEMPLLRCALGPTGRPFGAGLHSVTASGTDGRKAVITRNWDMAGSTLKKPIRGRKMGVGATARGAGYEYVRHGKGGNYAWSNGHVNMTTWEVMSTGKNGKIDWYYMPTPSSVPRPK